MGIFIGVDSGATKTHALAVDDTGKVLGFATGGPSATHIAGYEGFTAVVEACILQALKNTGVTKADVTSAGFGVSGYDWPGELPRTIEAARRIGLAGSMAIHSDGDLPLAIGAKEGWGVAICAGTGSVVTGMDADGRYARSTGGSVMLGELGGARELVFLAIQAVSHEYIRRGPHTLITDRMIAYAGAQGITDLLEDVKLGRKSIQPDFALQILKVAAEGDPVALELLRRSGQDLGLTAVGVIRQLGIQAQPFEVVLSGSMFKGRHPALVEPLTAEVLREAPLASFTYSEYSPALGGVVLAMKKVGFDFRPVRSTMIAGLSDWLKVR